jgi:transcriptional regulator with XRE-family HTH domain
MSMTLPLTFYRECQRRGWLIESATADGCVAKCPEPGCSVRMVIREGGVIPARASEDDDGWIVLKGASHAVEVGRQRRQQLRLSIAETEECAGLTADHIAKAETGRQFNLDTACAWFPAIGYDLVLIPRPLPAITLRVLAETRSKEDSRARRFSRGAREPQDERR